MKTLKLKAFTLMELTIAMLISAISIGMAFYMFQYFQQLFLQQQKQRQERFSYSLFKHLLEQDIDRSVWLKTSENGLICENEFGNISYEFAPKFIVRNQNTVEKDTFLIQTVNLDTTPRIQHLPSEELTDHIHLNIRFENKEHQFDYHKIYSAQQLLQLDSEVTN
ncbi:prepilin-type N-terminal cleavage/methylation domain-containing protein [Sphingobacterium sp. 2149]|uniref:prepilin-type N-terminal cleavage/methylation domain-containing protein n=1 Tax=Sphingobacterium sp. 2149 TaxID=2817763 RepID=UPI001AE5CE0C|nr:prepilin-type N-terminal cleavage/methylation domain-containing protein [Sphingobacterium sp. 2149]MDR6735546.1 type II secretory pathway pseudopilin PulG [Sphingobacterium sp. 2149]